MKVAGEVRMAASPERVLAVLGDPPRFVAALPNVGELDWEEREDGRLAATIRPATALGELPIRTVWEGRQVGSAGWHYLLEGRTEEHFVRMDAELDIRGQDGGGSIAAWHARLVVTGALRSASQRTITAIVRAQAASVIRAVDRAAG